MMSDHRCCTWPCPVCAPHLCPQTNVDMYNSGFAAGFEEGIKKAREEGGWARVNVRRAKFEAIRNEAEAARLLAGNGADEFAIRAESYEWVLALFAADLESGQPSPSTPQCPDCHEGTLHEGTGLCPSCASPEALAIEEALIEDRSVPLPGEGGRQPGIPEAAAMMDLGQRLYGRQEPSAVTTNPEPSPDREEDELRARVEEKARWYDQFGKEEGRFAAEIAAELRSLLDPTQTEAKPESIEETPSPDRSTDDLIARIQALIAGDGSPVDVGSMEYAYIQGLEAALTLIRESGLPSVNQVVVDRALLEWLMGRAEVIHDSAIELSSKAQAHQRLAATYVGRARRLREALNEGGQG